MLLIYTFRYGHALQEGPKELDVITTTNFHDSQIFSPYPEDVAKCFVPPPGDQGGLAKTESSWSR